MLEGVSGYCSVCVNRSSVLQYVAVCCSMLQYVAVCCSMLQCVVLQYVAGLLLSHPSLLFFSPFLEVVGYARPLQCVAVCCSVLQYLAGVAVCCSVLQCVAV